MRNVEFVEDLYGGHKTRDEEFKSSEHSRIMSRGDEVTEELLNTPEVKRMALTEKWEILAGIEKENATPF